MSENSQQTICVPDDLRNKKQVVLLAYQEAEDKIEQITKKLKETAEIHIKFGDYLIHSPTTHIYKVGAETHDHTVVQYDLREFVVLGNPQATFDLADDLRKAKRQLIDLSWEKQKLGLR